jgi:endonuclease G
MKNYRLSIIVSLLLAIVIGFNVNGSTSKYVKGAPISSFATPESKDVNAQQTFTPLIASIDLPLPLKDVSEQLLYRKAYIVSYNKDNRIPNWVAWHLTSEHTYGDVKRLGNAWHEDTDVPTPRASLADYKGSGWTRGHMCPAGDNKWNNDAMYESFLFTNCCPQNANLNSGTWNQIETSCRRWAEKYGDLYIVCGPILFRQEHEMIGENKVIVPEAFFKVIVCLKKGKEQGIGFICRNNDGNRNKDLYINTIKQVERITGITFFPHLPERIADKVKNKADINDWE